MDNNLEQDSGRASEETAAFFELILNWTFPGAALYYRDAEMTDEEISKYRPGQIIRSPFFVDVSNFSGYPVKNCRFAIATNKAAPIGDNELNCLPKKKEYEYMIDLEDGEAL